MALANTGLGAIVKFQGQKAVAGMGKVGKASTSMAKQVQMAGKSMGSGMQMVGSGITRAGVAFTPFSAALAVGGKMSVDFEQQMSSVQAVLNATSDEMTLLRNKAKDMGASTQFSATESAKAIEALGRAGFSTAENITALDGVMNLAAADAIDLETSAGIVAASVRGMGLAASEAGHVADVLTKASQRTNTNVTELGEAMKFAAPMAKTMGVNMAETVTILGALADTGIKGTLAGTSFKNALTKLAKPSSKANKMMEAYGITIERTKDGSLDLTKTFSGISQSLAGVGDKVKKAAILAELFGQRGMPAFTAFEGAMANTEKKGGQKLLNLMGELNEEMSRAEGQQGAAAKAAATRMDNMAGAMKILQSATESFALEFFEAFGGGGKDAIQQLSGFIQDIAKAMRMLNDPLNENDEEWKKIGGTAQAVAIGIKDGIDLISDGITYLKETARTAFAVVGDSDGTMVSSFAKIATVIGVVGGALAPLLIIGGMLVSMFGGLVSAAFGALSVPILIGVAAIALLGAEGESLSDTFMRVFAGIAGFVVGVFENVIKPIALTFWEYFQPALKGIQESFKQLFGSIIRTVSKFAPIFKFLASVIGGFAGIVARVIGGVFSSILDVVTFTIDTIVSLFQGAAILIMGFVAAADAVSKAFGGDGFGSAIQSLGDFALKDGERFSSDANQSAAENFGKQPKLEVAEATIGVEDADAQSVAQLANGIGTEIIAGSTANPDVNVDVQLEDKSTIENNTCLNIDGRQVAAANSRHTSEVKERRGMRDTPWQKRMIVEQGV